MAGQSRHSQPFVGCPAASRDLVFGWPVLLLAEDAKLLEEDEALLEDGDDAGASLGRVAGALGFLPDVTWDFSPRLHSWQTPKSS